MKPLFIISLFAFIQGIVIISLWCSRADYKDTCEAYRKELGETYLVAAQATLLAEKQQGMLEECNKKKGHLSLVYSRKGE
jgi:hypothetical protein